MKAVPLGLLTSTTASYDQTKTTLQGRIGLRSISNGVTSKQVVGPNPVITMDVFGDTGVSPGNVQASTTNGRIFIHKTNTLGVLVISYYLATTTSGVTTITYVGDLKFSFGAAANTYTVKGLKVDDTNPASMVFTWVATHGTATNGGLFVCWGVNVTDFVPVSVTTFPVATLANQTKATYMISDAATQAAHTMTVADGVGLYSTGSAIYVLNGAAATPKIYVVSYAAPPNTVPGANGYTNTNFTLQTGTLPALTGAVSLNNNVQVMTPRHTANANSVCLSWFTNSNIYIAKISDITAAVTSLPSLLTCDQNLGNDYIAPGNTKVGQYFSRIDRWVYSDAAGTYMVKKFISGDPNGFAFGVLSYLKSESGGTVTPQEFGGSIAPSCLTSMDGFAVITNTANGQRNAMALDLTISSLFPDPVSGEIQTSIISPVITTSGIRQGVYLSLLKELAQRTVYPGIQYRTSNFSIGPGTGFDATWTTAPIDGDLSALINATQVQFRILFQGININVTNPSQIVEAYFNYFSTSEISDKWEGSVDNTSVNGASPAYTAFRQTRSDSGTKYFRAYDDSGNLIVSANTSANFAFFDKSTNNGASWTPMSGANDYSSTPLTTEIRYKWASPPGVKVTCSLGDS